MLDELQQSLRNDCLVSLGGLGDLSKRLTGHRIAVVGGTGFVGAWLAEAVAALNKDLGSQVRIDLLGRSAAAWLEAHPHLNHDFVSAQTMDVRSPFELARDTTLVLFAAGHADPRMHASDPRQVFETSVHGVGHALAAAARLELLQRFVNISSGLVLGGVPGDRALNESAIGALDFTRLHNVYAEARRSAESLTTAYASQYRIPVSTARAFTFIGPYQALDAPWALNNFMRDALSGNNIRIHGDGATRRGYLYGSDAAAWLLKLLLDGRDGEAYNLGGEEPISHSDVASLVASLIASAPEQVHKSRPGASGRNHDFFPDLAHTMATLGVRQTVGVKAAIEKSLHWHARRLGVMRRLRDHQGVR
ncbi:MAG TPA: NAD(P)-dependent oxidoreductase [Ideonella sp.]|uniref:NAD-dependent epimerase/dehydratase family protein n=1 Tax=Ideonella sp. TaxID=1929293 RepID=UPI002D096B5B|nr:NAD(P)-dependent oxidoreductase [Ideonella sp.]HSI48421.1 NAD(P)-dependent oxidoreductase [Ideonella sp.]